MQETPAAAWTSQDGENGVPLLEPGCWILGRSLPRFCRLSIYEGSSWSTYMSPPKLCWWQRRQAWEVGLVTDRGAFSERSCSHRLYPFSSTATCFLFMS